MDIYGWSRPDGYSHHREAQELLTNRSEQAHCPSRRGRVWGPRTTTPSSGCSCLGLALGSVSPLAWPIRGSTPSAPLSLLPHRAGAMGTRLRPTAPSHRLRDPRPSAGSWGRAGARARVLLPPSVAACPVGLGGCHVASSAAQPLLPICRAWSLADGPASAVPHGYSLDVGGPGGARWGLSAWQGPGLSHSGQGTEVGSCQSRSLSAGSSQGPERSAGDSFPRSWRS